MSKTSTGINARKISSEFWSLEGAIYKAWHYMALLSDPGAVCGLIPPPRPGQIDPALTESSPNIGFPLGMTVGSGDFAVQSISVLVFGRDQGIDRLARRQWQCIGITHGDKTITCKPYRSPFIISLELAVALLHALPEAGNCWRIDFDIGLRVTRIRHR